jgi:TP901 family phage tail tape measure protein
MSFELVGIRLVAEDGANYITTVTKADKATTGFGDTSAGVFKQLPSLSDIAVGALHKVGEIAVSAFMQAGRAAVGFFKDSISAAGDFEAGMNTFTAVAGGALDEAGLKTKDFRDLFLQLGKELPVSTAEVQQAATEMIKGGIDPATIAAGGLKQEIQFASAAMGGDLVGAATVSAKILGGWAEQGATAAEKAQLLTTATDLLTKAANASTVDVKELALGLYNVQGTAKTTGLSLEETTTALAELSPRFASSSEAGTSFKNFLVRLQPTTKPAIAAMKGLGLYTDEAGSAFFDAQGKFIGVAKASDLLHDKLNGLTDAQRVSLLQTIFGNDAMNAAAAFAENGAHGFDDMAAAMAKANGVQANAATMQQGYNVALDNFHGSIEALQITIGSVFLPILTDLFNNVLAPAINTLTDLSGALSGDSDAFGRLSPILQAVVGWFGGMSDSTGGLSDLWTNTLQPAIAAVGDYFEQKIAPILMNIGTIVLPLLGAAAQVLGGLWSDVLWPALQLVGDYLDQFVIPLLTDVTAWLAKNLPPAITAVSAFLTGTLFPAIHDVFDFIDANLIPVFADVRDWLEKNLPPAIQTVADFWNNTLWPALNKVWSFISANIIPIIQSLIGTHLANLDTGVQKTADFWNNTLKPALDAVWAFLDKYVIPIFTALANVISAVVGKATEDYTNKLNTGLLPGLQAVYNFAHDYLIPDLSEQAAGFKTVSDFVSSTFGPVLADLRDNVLKGIAEWFGHIADGIQIVIGFLNDLADKIRNLPSLPSAYVGHSPPPMADWFKEIGLQASEAANQLASVAYQILHMPKAPSGSLADAFGGIGGYIGGGGGGMRLPLSAGALALRGVGAQNTATYNQQRSVNLTYHTQYAPPVDHSMAIANALAG